MTGRPGVRVSMEKPRKRRSCRGRLMGAAGSGATPARTARPRAKTGACGNKKALGRSESSEDCCSRSCLTASHSLNRFRPRGDVRGDTSARVHWVSTSGGRGFDRAALWSVRLFTNCVQVRRNSCFDAFTDRASRSAAPRSRCAQREQSASRLPSSGALETGFSVPLIPDPRLRHLQRRRDGPDTLASRGSPPNLPA